MATKRVLNQKVPQLKALARCSGRIYGNHLIPGYAAILAGNLAAGGSALIDYASKYALDMSDLVQGLGQRGWVEPSVLLLLAAPLQSAQQVVASCWPIPLQATPALGPFIGQSAEAGSNSQNLVLNDTVADFREQADVATIRLTLCPLQQQMWFQVSTRAQRENAVAYDGCNSCCCAHYTVVQTVLNILYPIYDNTLPCLFRAVRI